MNSGLALEAQYENAPSRTTIDYPEASGNLRCCYMRSNAFLNKCTQALPALQTGCVQAKLCANKDMLLF